MMPFSLKYRQLVPGCQYIFFFLFFLISSLKKQNESSFRNLIGSIQRLTAPALPLREYAVAAAAGGQRRKREKK